MGGEGGGKGQPHRRAAANIVDVLTNNISRHHNERITMEEACSRTLPLIRVKRLGPPSRVRLGPPSRVKERELGPSEREGAWAE